MTRPAPHLTPIRCGAAARTMNAPSTDPDAPVPPDARPSATPRRTAGQRVYELLVSPKLAIALLVGILACCVVGVTVMSSDRASAVIFSTLWFNALLVLLAVSSAAAFFTRIWRRK